MGLGRLPPSLLPRAPTSSSMIPGRRSHPTTISAITIRSIPAESFIDGLETLVRTYCDLRGFILLGAGADNTGEMRLGSHPLHPSPKSRKNQPRSRAHVYTCAFLYLLLKPPSHNMSVLYFVYGSNMFRGFFGCAGGEKARPACYFPTSERNFSVSSPSHMLALILRS